MDADARSTLTRIFVPAMDCPDEEKEIRTALSRLPGVESLAFRLLSRQVEVRHRCDVGEILAALKEIGMEGRPVEDSLRREDLPGTGGEHLAAFVLSAALLSAGAASVLLFPAVSWTKGFFLAAVLAGGAGVALRGIREVRNRSLGMHALMTISIGGATLLGEWEEAAVVVCLFALANTLEAKSLDRARRASAGLFSLAPETAIVREGGVDGRERTVPADEVRPGDILVIRPGARVPVDATVYKGRSDLNESMLTGEPVPIDKREGDLLHAGTVNGRNPLLARAIRPLSESTVARILRHVEEAQANKAPIETFLERFAARYTPAVLAAALLVAILPPLLGRGSAADWAYRGLVLLVIACPCAIVLAAPVATVSALTRAGRSGILVKGANRLEALGTVRAVAFDKTGTLTRGTLRVAGVRAAPGVGEAEVVRLAGAVEAGSAHPAAEAIRHEARRRGIDRPARGTLARTFETLEGRGVSAVVEGKRVYVGNRDLFSGEATARGAREGILPAGEERNGRTLILVGTDEGIAGGIELTDELRPEAREAVRELAAIGVEHVVMLTGDRRQAALAAGEAVGIGEIRHGLLPEEKLEQVRELVAKYGAVAMVGDGVNDAPALALSPVGIAMGAAGSPAAIETADVALLTEDLRRVPEAIRLGRRMVSVIRQNVAASLAIKAGFVAAAAAGYATLWMAVAADMGTTLLVIFNGLRLLRNDGFSG
ncbi:MAG: heavy metal translocating P-type ATPase [Deltaproteobacteria bacterium]